MQPPRLLLPHEAAADEQQEQQQTADVPIFWGTEWATAFEQEMKQQLRCLALCQRALCWFLLQYISAQQAAGYLASFCAVVCKDSADTTAALEDMLGWQSLEWWAVTVLAVLAAYRLYPSQASRIQPAMLQRVSAVCT
jgi:hypothetical protein